MDQDDVDTVPVIMRDTHVEFGSENVPASDSLTIRLPVTKTMRSPSLFASVNPRDEGVVVEEVTCEGSTVEVLDAPVESLRFGHRLDASLAEGTTLAVRIRNTTDREVRVGVSLVSTGLVDEG